MLINRGGEAVECKHFQSVYSQSCTNGGLAGLCDCSCDIVRRHDQWFREHPFAQIAIGPPPPNGQCPNRGGDKLKGASLWASDSVAQQGKKLWDLSTKKNDTHGDFLPMIEKPGVESSNCQQASKQTNKQASKQASERASEQTSNHTTKTS